MARGSGTATRGRILTAAATMFAERGFAGVTVRDIAADAGADAALVIRHFGSKELLFLEAVHSRFADRPLDDVPLEDLGRSFTTSLLDADEATRGVYLALLRGSDRPRIKARLTTNHESHFVAPLRARLSGPDADTRARLAGALLAGLLYSLWVVEDPGLRAMDRAELVERYGGLLQRLLTG
ncbi:TetR/AcrR family transcriptional regulator [Cellulomonas sp. KRMCY2]|uniref:TetR/AcrR family transcriptional regulator n=1 Tax=Cellulomonas sp. KRMCY2 TaxID=1304865 RepID=UPI00045E94F0|nr:TetR/AcrR family transcriptional regulator [Cellulomonas sp. KRMCY2]